MNADSEIIALLLLETDEPKSAGSDPVATARRLVRGPDGQVSLETICSRDEFDRTARHTGCFRRGKPIWDPESREVIGYEMEEVSPLEVASTA